ncbi:MAG: M3 family metallopeptidase [Akkermansia sp.]|nr:M3 family metallopeptidase [Akkermansia sp.]
MTTRNILLTAMCALTGMSTLQAADIVESVAPAQVASVQKEHPFFQDMPYPAWSQLTAEQALVDARVGIKLAYQRIDAISKVKPDETTFENTFLALAYASRELDQVQGYMHHLSSVMDSPEMRAAQQELIPELNELSAAITANEQLWTVIKSAAAQPWVKQLSSQKQRFVQQTVDSFRDSGADLSPDKKARKAEIEAELSQLTLNFAKNVLDSTNEWELIITDKAELAGMREDWLAAAAADAAEHGYGTAEAPAWRITLDYTSYGSVLSDCTVESTRKKCWEGQNSIGNGEKYDNEKIVARVMVLRRELAELLGFGTYADLKTMRRMVGGGDNAMAFIDGMMEKVKPAFEQECQQVLDYVSTCRGEKVTAVNPWDRRYYMTQMAKEQYNFDPETLRPYQECNRVIQGMFSTFGPLYGVAYEEVPTACLKPGEACPEGAIEVWHPEVRCFKVTDSATGNHLGTFYMDLFPRATKRAGAWVMPMRYGKPATATAPHEPHLATVTANLTAPTANKPALFSHYDVETLYHEFGHMMHCMCGDTELESHCGTSVTWDFVELPSQIQENWTWEPEGIAQFAFHYETGEPIPAEMIEKLNASRYFLPATDIMSQLCVGKLDLEMHVNWEEKFAGKCIDKASNDLLRPWRIAMTADASSIMRHLTHCINGGYAAGYYSYKWAEVLAADAFTRFKKEGVLNPATGADFRKFILSVGDGKPAAEAYRDFMGRDPNPDALLEAHGLITK